MTDQATNPKHDETRPKGEFAHRECSRFWSGPVVALIAVLTAVTLSVVSCRRNTAADEVILYCAQDQNYAEPILQQFEQETGIRVKTVYDSEAVKTVGLANRLLAERDRPQCDIFWGNEACWRRNRCLSPP